MARLGRSRGKDVANVSQTYPVCDGCGDLGHTLANCPREQGKAEEVNQVGGERKQDLNATHYHPGLRNHPNLRVEVNNMTRAVNKAIIKAVTKEIKVLRDTSKGAISKGTTNIINPSSTNNRETSRTNLQLVSTLRSGKVYNNVTSASPDVEGVVVDLGEDDAIRQVPAYAKYLKDLCTQKRHHKMPKKLDLIDNVSVVLSGSLPPKLQDPGAPLISMQIGELKINRVLLDIGASVSILSGILYGQYDFGPLQKADTTVVLADLTHKFPWGILTDVIVKVEDFYYPLDFLVLDYAAPSSDRHPNVILGRPFLRTTQCVINCVTGTFDMAFGNRKLRLNIFSRIFNAPIIDKCFMADVVDRCNPHENEGESMEPCVVCDRKEAGHKQELKEAEAQGEVCDLRERVPTWTHRVENLPDHIDTHLKPSLESRPKLELKELPKHLKYAFVGENDTLPVIIATGLTEEQEQSLMTVDMS
ncbi:hypothetical protein L1987_25371 [Smallanthus sonchifolius]|uniref:Uncharacterized protein n=1 Tax=Smallanthus sonchifolius TaxID=185202 RepID=A0ACB9IN23_9ASTR|nr:hypothetical protein L1987_25371 [Smallanthus sonchifolius]